MILNMREYYEMINEFNINIIYSGPLWADNVETIAETLKRRMELDALPLSLSKSIFSVFVEQMNNILMYSEEKEDFFYPDDNLSHVSKGIFVLGSKDKVYFIQSGNVIKTDSVEFIKEQLDYLNSLDKADLRKYYNKRIRSENANPVSKGGGIGFIEIARRASTKIEYSFEPYCDDLTFFSMYVQI